MHLVHDLITYRYEALFALAILESTIASLSAGALVALGYFDAPLAFGVLASRDVVCDTVLYCVGATGSPVLGRLFAPLRERLRFADDMAYAFKRGWYEQPILFMWIAKFAYGISPMLIMSAGATGLPLPTFYRCALPVTVITFAVLMAAGYFLGLYVASENPEVAGAEIVLGVVALTVCMWLLTRLVRARADRPVDADK